MIELSSPASHWLLFSTAAISVGFVFTGDPLYLIPLAASAGLLAGGRVYTTFMSFEAANRLVVERRLIGSMTEKEPHRVELSLRNKGALPVHLESLLDEPPIYLGRAFQAKDIYISRGGEVTLSYDIVGRLGRWCFSYVKLRIADPLGFSASEVSVNTARGRCFTFKPRLIARALPAARIGGREGISRASGLHSRGSGVDYYSFRDYQPGDEPRMIEWKMTARRGQPVVKETAGEGRGPQALIIVAASSDDWLIKGPEDTPYELVARTAFNIMAALQEAGAKVKLNLISRKGFVEVYDINSAAEVLSEAVLPPKATLIGAAQEAVTGSGGLKVLVTSLAAEDLGVGGEAVVVSTIRGDFTVKSDNDIVKVVEAIAHEAFKGH